MRWILQCTVEQLSERMGKVWCAGMAECEYSAQDSVVQQYSTFFRVARCKVSTTKEGGIGRGSVRQVYYYN